LQRFLKGRLWGAAVTSEHAPIRLTSNDEIFAGAPSFSLRNRLVRLVWNVAWLVLAAWTPPPLRWWRIALLRAFGAKIDRTANVYASARIWLPANLSMAPYAALGPRATCYNMAPIAVGERAVVSQGAHLCGGTHLVDDPSFQLVAKPIAIGARAWVAAEAFVGPGVTIGEGAVLGARGVTVKDLDDWTIYAGNPARAIRKRARDH
jgi:putative colanic acid biosynthesis acetyltransferase WcaF